MTQAQQAQLADNLRRDGAVTSAILIYRAPGMNEEEILSGHHRVEAAIAAGLETVPCILITTELTEARKRAIQLSHNSIVGQDDPSVLAQMYADLDLGAKVYSGLDDSILANAAKISLAGLGLSIKYQEMNLFFLAEDAAVVEALMPRLEKAGRANRAYVAPIADWDRFFDLMVRAKAKFRVFNSGIAFRMLLDLAGQALDAMEEPQTEDQA